MGERLRGRYHILRKIGKGGFGETFLAEDLILPGHPWRVIKQLKPQSIAPNGFKTEDLEKAKERFYREADVLRQLGCHPQIPNLFDRFEENNEFYLVQEYIKGENLSQELKPHQQWNELKVINLLQDILGILAFVHYEKQIHRDVKPDNLIRREMDLRLVLIDFGAVKDISDIEGIPQPIKSTMMVGTPRYRPSEVAQGTPKPCSDLYAVGIIGIQALTGLPIEEIAEDPESAEIIWQPPPSVNLKLVDILKKMVLYDFRQRYQSATEVLTAINELDNSTSTLPTTADIKQADQLLPLKPSIKFSPTPKRIGQYDIVKPLGSGLVGQSYLVTKNDESGKKYYTIKQLKFNNSTPSSLEAAKNLFNSEAQMLSQLGDKCEGISKIVHYLEQNQTFYLIHEFIEGHTLNEEIRPGIPLPASKVFDLVREMLEALELIHQHSVIHGNIHPRHIVRRQKDQKLVLIDFGTLKKIKVLQSSCPSLDAQMSDAAYIPLEIDKIRNNFTQDIYAVGIIGIQAWTGLTPRQIKQQIEQNDNPKCWRKKVDKMIPELAEILERMTYQSNEDMYPSAHEARRAFCKLLEKWLKNGNWYMDKKQFAEAVSAYDEVLVEMPNFYRALYQKGEALFRWGKYEEAMDCFKTVIQLKSDYFKALYGMGNVLQEQQHYEEAIAYYQETVKINPNFYKAWHQWGVTIQKMDRYKEAIVCYRKAVLLRPGHQDSWYCLGDVLEKLERYKEALNAYEEAIEIRPKNPELWYRKGRVLGKMNEYSKAIDAYKEAVKINPIFAEAWYAKGELFETFNQIDEAINAYNRAVTIQPDFTAAMERIKLLKPTNISLYIKQLKNIFRLKK